MTEDKFQAEDLPKILAAIQTARASKQFATVTVNFAENGGTIAIHLKTEKKFK